VKRPRVEGDISYWLLEISVRAFILAGFDSDECLTLGKRALTELK
jgi:hypothetical protein